MTFPAIYRVGGGEWPHTSVFVPVMIYPVYKIWEKSTTKYVV